MTNVSIYGSHHAAIAVEQRGQYFIVEIEKYLHSKNSGLTGFFPVGNPAKTTIEIVRYIRERLSLKDKFEAAGYSDLGPAAPFLVGQVLQPSSATLVSHHHAHAANAFFQSPYKQALVITADSGSDDGMFNIQLADREKGFSTIHKFPFNLGYLYAMIGSFLLKAKKSVSLLQANLSYAHSVMNLSAYGHPRAEWLPVFEKLFRNQLLIGNELPCSTLVEPYHQEDLDLVTSVLSRLLDLPLKEGVDGIAAFDLAATAQRALENVVLSSIEPFVSQYTHLPLCFGGGCAHNVYLNSRIRQHFDRPLFVPPNPGNDGIALGIITLINPPRETVDFSYSSFPLVDSATLDAEKSTRKHEVVTPQKVARLLADSKIVGVARGGGDHGSYSLGNRSIFANAMVPNITAFIREAIKKTETFVPFDAMVRAENADRYFEKGTATRYPNFAINVLEQYDKTLSSITHIDGTARVLSIGKEQHPWLHDVLKWFEAYTGEGVLLHTPLCEPDDPVISHVPQLFEFFDRTLLEALVVEDNLFIRTYS